MIRYFKHYDIDKAKWDACIEKSTNGIIYAYSWYLDIVSPGWEALVTGDYDIIMPLTQRKKYGIHYLYQPYFTQQLGVFFSGKPDEQIVGNFLNAIPSSYRFVEINLNTFNKISLPEYIIKSSLTHELPLNDTYENRYKQFSENNRRNVKKAEKSHLKIVYDVNASDIINMFRKNRGKDIRNLKNKDYDMLQKLIEECNRRGVAEILGVKTSSSELCAGAFFVEKNGKKIFLFSAINEEGKKYSAMFFLINHVIKKAILCETKIDFHGSNDSDIARFYKGFGAQEINYYKAKKNKLPVILRMIKK